MATSDEQRAALRLIVQKIAARSVEEANYSTAFKREQLAEAWAEFDAQQAPQERADRALLERCRYEIMSHYGIRHDEMVYVPKAIDGLLRDLDAALAANPQQIASEPKERERGDV